MKLTWHHAVAYLPLFAIAIPWYWRWLPVDGMSTSLADVPLPMPLWVVVSLLGSLALSIYTAWLLRTPWPQESEPPSEGGA